MLADQQHDPFRNYCDRKDELLLHATGVAMDNVGLVIVGPSGCGKTTLALQLMAYGAELVSDDRVYVLPGSDNPIIKRPDEIAHQIEVWGFGVMPSASRAEAPLSCIIDLSQGGERRFPMPDPTYLLGYRVPLFRCTLNMGTGAAILHLMRSFGSDENWY